MKILRKFLWLFKSNVMVFDVKGEYDKYLNVRSGCIFYKEASTCITVKMGGELNRFNFETGKQADKAIKQLIGALK